MMNVVEAIGAVLEAKKLKPQLMGCEVAEAVGKLTGMTAAAVLPAVEAELRRRFDPLLHIGDGLRHRCFIVEDGVETYIQIGALTVEQTDAVIAALKTAAKRTLSDAAELGVLRDAEKAKGENHDYASFRSHRGSRSR